MSDADHMHRRSTEQGRELREAVTKLKEQREAELAAKAVQPAPPIDFQELARSKGTGAIVGVLVSEKRRMAVVDPDGALQARSLSDDGEESDVADSEIDARLDALTEAALAELDRRIPIPEGR